MSKEKQSETVLAAVVSKWLEKTGHEVFPEVVIKGFGGRPDMIATRNNLAKVFECKVNSNFSVVEQAVRWRHPHRSIQDGMPHLIYIAVFNYTFGSSHLLKMMLMQYGIGVIAIRERHRSYNENLQNDEVLVDDKIYHVEERLAPRIQPGSRQFGKRLISMLNPDMRIATPGARGGETEYMTPFKRTMNLVKTVVADGKEWHCQTIVAAINMMGGHHYASDKGCANAIVQHCDLIGCEYLGWSRVKLKK